MLWKIKVITNGLCEKDVNTLYFAAEELKKYLLQSVSDEIIICGGGEATEGAIRLGIGLREDIPTVEDTYYDDAIVIDIKGQSGVITGTNARSVLIGTYRYLRELGYTFIRPGKEGEKCPEVFEIKDVFVCEAADHRCRHLCSEGSIFYEAVEDLIDWIPKVGFNGYYTQFFTPWIFYKRWYHHQGYELKNPYLTPEPLEVEDVAGFVKAYEREIKKRSLINQRVGHGWTCDPFGMTSLGWESVPEDTIPKDIVEKYFAMLGGKRRIYNDNPSYYNVPLVNQLCYSNPEVSERIISSFVDYCRENPDSDIVGFSLADGGNAYCECEECKKLRPSDYAIKMITEIDRRLRAEGLKTKINFDLYVDRLWKPLEAKLPEDQSGLLLHLAPIHRTYTKPFPKTTNCKTREFKYNKNEFPESVEENLAYVNEWKELYHGRMVCYDYYYMWDCYKDIGMTETARVIHQDIVNYKDMNMDGLISCQSQRVFCPTSLGMNVMAKTLWNRNEKFDDIRDYVLRAEYGKDFELVRDYLQELSIYGLPEVIRMEKPFSTEENYASFKKCHERISSFVQTINEHIESAPNECERISWKNLKFHSDVTSMMMEAFCAMIKGADHVPLRAMLEDYINRNEYEFKQYFDAFEFKRTIVRLLPMLAEEKGEKKIM